MFNKTHNALRRFLTYSGIACLSVFGLMSLSGGLAVYLDRSSADFHNAIVYEVERVPSSKANPYAHGKDLQIAIVAAKCVEKFGRTSKKAQVYDSGSLLVLTSCLATDYRWANHSYDVQFPNQDEVIDIAAAEHLEIRPYARTWSGLLAFVGKAFVAFQGIIALAVFALCTVRRRDIEDEKDEWKSNILSIPAFFAFAVGFFAHALFVRLPSRIIGFLRPVERLKARAEEGKLREILGPLSSHLDVIRALRDHLGLIRDSAKRQKRMEELDKLESKLRVRVEHDAKDVAEIQESIEEQFDAQIEALQAAIDVSRDVSSN